MRAPRGRADAAVFRSEPADDAAIGPPGRPGDAAGRPAPRVAGVQRGARRHSDVTSAARAACSGSSASAARGCRGRDLAAADHAQPRLLERREQLGARAQAKMLGEIRQHQPAFALRLEMRGEPGEKALQHAAVRVVDRVFQRGGGLRRKPRRVADDERRPSRPGRDRPGPPRRDRRGRAAAMLSRAHASARGSCSVATTRCDPAPRKHGGEHAGPRADVEGERARRQRRLGHQLHVLAAHRREHAVVRVDAVAERRDQRRPSCAIRARRSRPAARAATRRTARRPRPRPRRTRGARRARAAAERCCRRRTAAAASRACARAAPAPGAADGNAIVGDGGGGRRLARLAVGAPRHRLQQLAGVLEIAAPQQRGARARQTKRRIGGHAVVGDDHLRGRRQAALRAPAGAPLLARLGPAYQRVHAADLGLARA